LIERTSVVNENPTPDPHFALRSAAVNDLYAYLGPALRMLPPEVAHDLALRAMALGLVRARRPSRDPRLQCTCFGRTLPNPFGIAAGFDKDAAAVDGLFELGFGFVEVGTVTPRPQAGNPRPRLFRLKKERALVNRMGFNNEGLAALVARVGRFRAGPHGERLLGINLGKNKDTEDAAADYVKGIEAAAPLADFIVVNVSSPNTPGLRSLQGREALDALLRRVQDALAATGRSVPLLVKIAPDLSQADREDVAEVAIARRLDGLVVSNTTVARPPSLVSKHRGETGGLSGPPVFEPSTELLRQMVKLTAGKLVFIGVGGVSSGADAYAKIRAGASLVQVYTSFIYQGPGLVGRLEGELSALLERDGFASVAEAVGADQR
jgi:dihydroorotate dehydrogenase